MAKKIILFLSELRGAQQEETYDCPDGGQATGGRPMRRRFSICCGSIPMSGRSSAW